MRLVALAILVTLGLCAGAQARLSPLELGCDEAPDDWSPDGRRILYGCAYEPPKGGADFFLLVVGSDGTGKRLLFRRAPALEERWDTGGQFSPDGTRIVFGRRSGLTDDDVMVVGADGRGLTNLTGDGTPAGEYGGVWAPDGRLIAFTRSDRARAGRTGLWVMRPDGSGQRQLTQHDFDFGPVWSPDGSTLAFTRFTSTQASGATTAVWTVRADGTGARKVTGDGRYELAGWSPDGSTVLYTVRGGPNETKAAVWAMRPDGSGKRKLLDGDSPSWSPDGRRIAFFRWQHDRRYPGTTYLANADGSGVRPVFVGGFALVWSPDSRRLAGTAARGCNGAGVFVVDVVTARARRLTNDCRIVGTPRDDRIRGTLERDLIRALGGDDRIDANPGDGPPVYYGRSDYDVVAAGTGNDVVLGRRGLDVIDGEPGADRLFGGRGGDRLSGGPGRDVVDAGPYDDRIAVRDGARDVVRCGVGNDRVVADRFDAVAADCERVVRR